MSMIKKIERSALGRVARLGDLYDARADAFCAMSMLTAALPPSVVTVTDNYSNNTNFVYNETFQEKCHVLNISAELQVSLVCLPIQASGAAKYMQDQKSSARSLRTTMLCDVTTKYEQLQLSYDNLKPLISMDAIKDKNATHVVVGIQWGGNAYISVELEDSDETDNLEFGGQLAAKLKTVIVDISANADVNWDQKTKNLAKRLNFKIYGDVLPDKSDDIPLTFKDACQQVKQLRERITNANDGKGKPINYILLPLSNESFRKSLRLTEAVTNLYKEIQESAVMQFIELFDNISYVKQQVNDLVTDIDNFRTCLSTEIIQKAQDLKSGLEVGESTLKGKLANALIAVRAGEENVSLLNKLMKEYMISDDSYTKVKRKCETEFISHRKKMDFAKACVKYGVKFLNGGTPIDSILIIHEDVYVLYASDELIEKNPQTWETNRIAFFNIAKSIMSSNVTGAGTEPKTAFIFLDCGFNPALLAKEGIRIRQYRNNSPVFDDVAKQQVAYLALNVAFSNGVVGMESNVPQKMVQVKGRCPKSFKGECLGSERQWVCRKCRQTLQLGMDDDFFYCPCGRAPADSFKYRCCDKVNHLMEEFVPFDKANFDAFLRSLRSKDFAFSDQICTTKEYSVKNCKEFNDGDLQIVKPGIRISGMVVYVIRSPVCIADVIGGLEITYDLDGTGTITVRHGDTLRGKRYEFSLQSDERIVYVKVKHGWCIDSMTFGTNKGKQYQCGGIGGTRCDLYEKDYSRFPRAKLAVVKGREYTEDNGVVTIRFLQFGWSNAS